MLKIEEMCVNLHGIFDNSKRMRQRNTLYLMLMTVMVLMTSCSKTDDDYEVTLYGDAAITSFTLGTVTRVVEGDKSTYAGSLYTFTIDPIHHIIVNTDSLLVGSRADSITCSISTLNNGAVAIKNLKDDNYTWYSSSTAIDFSQERIFRIYPSNGQGYTEYTVKVNVHKQDGEIYDWKEATADWPSEELLGQSSYEEYGVQSDGKPAERAIGTTEWKPISDGKPAEETQDKMLPVSNLALVSYPMQYTDSTDYVVLAGKAADGTTVIWRKEVANYGKKAKGVWTYMDTDDWNKYQLKEMANLRLFYYDSKIYAMGGDYQTFYQSRDNGITWKEDMNFMTPEGFDGNDDPNKNVKVVNVVKTDKDNYLWLYCTLKDDSHKIWKGRLNRLGWKK